MSQVSLVKNIFSSSCLHPTDLILLSPENKLLKTTNFCSVRYLHSRQIVESVSFVLTRKFTCHIIYEKSFVTSREIKGTITEVLIVIISNNIYIYSYATSCSAIQFLYDAEVCSLFLRESLNYEYNRYF